MPYNEEIDSRIQKIVCRWKGTSYRKMFGGVCHLLQGNMLCGVYKDFLILRLGTENAYHALQLPFVKVFDITGKPMKGWVMVERRGFKTEKELREWLKMAKEFVKSLSPK